MGEVQMSDKRHIAFLRGAEEAGASAHPILELSDEELRRVIGGDDEPVLKKASKITGSYDTSSGSCCDGTKVCCG
jgi:hypothetical protein